MARRQLFFKVSAMYGGSVLSSILALLTSILNTSILGTAGFGDFKFIETVVRFVASITTAGYFVSITRLLAITDNSSYKRKLVGYTVVILMLMGLIASIIIIVFSFVEPVYFENGLGPVLRTYFLIVVAFLMSLAIYQILIGLNHIYTIVLLTVLPGLLYLIIAYPLSLYSLMNLELILIISYGLVFSICAVIIYRLKPNFNYTKSLVRKVSEENKTNGRPVYIGSLAGVATTHIAGFSISYFLDNTQLGFYMLALTVCSPLLTIPSVLGTTFFKHFANASKIPAKVFLFTILISTPVLFVFYFFIEDIIVFFYSESFRPAAELAKILIIAFLFHGLGDLLNRFIGAKGKGNMLRNTAFIVGGINVLGYTLLAYFFKMDGIIFTKVFASFSYFMIMLLFYRKLIKNVNNV